MTKKDFSVHIDEENNLVISMEKKTETKEEKNKDEETEGRYLRREFSYTKFQQTMIPVSYTHLDVYKRQREQCQLCLVSTDGIHFLAIIHFVHIVEHKHILLRIQVVVGVPYR